MPLKQAGPEDTLCEQVQLACWGHSVSDVAAMASGLLMQCLVLMGSSRQGALDAADASFAEMRAIIARDYEEMLQREVSSRARN
jgi:hypothetical protein